LRLFASGAVIACVVWLRPLDGCVWWCCVQPCRCSQFPVPNFLGGLIGSCQRVSDKWLAVAHPTFSTSHPRIGVLCMWRCEIRAPRAFSVGRLLAVLTPRGDRSHRQGLTWRGSGDRGAHYRRFSRREVDTHPVKFVSAQRLFGEPAGI
jgi:hypothetical protein